MNKRNRNRRSSAKIIIKSIKFHRNGSFGDSFHCVQFNMNDEKGIPRDFFATIGYDDDGELLDEETCRVICPEKPTETWRGGQMAEDIIKAGRRALNARGFICPPNDFTGEIY